MNKYRVKDNDLKTSILKLPFMLYWSRTYVIV